MKHFISIFLIIAVNSLYSQDKLFYDFELSTSGFPEISIQGRLNNKLLINNDFNQNNFQVNIQDSDSCNYSLLSFSQLDFADTLSIHIIIESDKINPKNINSLFEYFNKISFDNQNIKVHWYATSRDSIFSTFYVPELLNSNIKFSYWENKFSNLLQNLPNQNKHLVIQLIEKEDPILRQETIELIKKSKNEKNIVAGFLYLKKSKKGKIIEAESNENIATIMDKYLLFESSFPNHDMLKVIDNQIFLFLSSIYQLTFSVPFKLDVEYSSLIQVSLMTPQDTFGLEQKTYYPQKKYNEVFVDSTLAYTSKSFHSKKYKNALDTLLYAKNQIKNYKFDSLAKEILKVVGQDYKVNGKDPSYYFILAEDLWGISAENTFWYKTLKLEILDIFFNSLQSKGVFTNKLIEINSERRILEPQNIQYTLIDLKLKATGEEEKNNLTKSLEYYDEYLQLDKDKLVEEKLKKNISTIITNNYTNKNFLIAYNTAKQYFDYLKNNFRLRYLYASSCLNVKDYNTSIINYDWLINNWDKKQSVVTWDEAFSSIENLYTQTYNFDQALILNQRYYRQTSNYDLLKSYVKNIRLYYLKPVIDAFKLHSSSSRFKDVIKIFNKDIVDFPHYMINIYLMEDGNITEKFYKEKAVTSPDLKRILLNIDYPAIEQTQDRIWFIDKFSSNRFIVFELQNKIDLVEESLFAEITKKKEMAEPWKNLMDYESEQLRTFSTVLITNIIGKDALKNYPNSLSKYNSLVNDNPLIEYLSFYNQKGENIYSINFNKADGDFNQESLQRSIVTNAFFKQDINYKGYKLIDICNPFYRDNMRELVVRIGIKPN